MADFANDSVLDDIRENNTPEYLRTSKIIFQTFDWFTKISEEKQIQNINKWAEKQTEDGHNAISNLLIWTTALKLKPVFRF